VITDQVATAPCTDPIQQSHQEGIARELVLRDVKERRRENASALDLVDLKRVTAVHVVNSEYHWQRHVIGAAELNPHCLSGERTEIEWSSQDVHSRRGAILIGFAQKSNRMTFLACDSRRKHKAWGASPRFKYKKNRSDPATAGESL